MTIRCRAAALSILLLCPLTAAAQQPPEKPPAGQPQDDKDKPKQPAPPLFPRHRRGLYKNTEGVVVIDATPQSPPLETDDPGVPDKGEYEINLLTRADYGKAAQRVDLMFVDVNYGILPVIAGHKLPTQIKLEFPVAAGRDTGEPFGVGLGAAKIGMKLNFYRDEHRGISVALYPQVEFPTPGGNGVEKGLADTGQTLILPLIVAREFHELTFVFNAAVEKPIHDPEREMSAEFGAAIGRAFTRKDALMIELRTATNRDFKSDRLVAVNAGFIHGVRNIIVYGNLGHSLFSDDGGHTYAGIGIKFTIH